jgi:type I restriction enzyme R subunit
MKGNIKVIPRHQQYFATEKVFERVDDIKNRGINGARGLIWHTQGSGKSFTMYFASRIASRNRGSRVLILVDRKDLREQMGEELTRIESGFDTTVVTSQDELIEAVEGSHDIILTTIQLFDGIKEPIQGGRETYIFSDEAHRNMEKDYGSHLEAAFPPKSRPHVHHFGFTGTPVSSKNRDTFNHYTVDGYKEDEPYLHRYSMKRGVEEGTIVEVDITERKNILDWKIDKDRIDNSFLEQFGDKNQDEVLKYVDEELTVRDVAEHSGRTDAIAQDINNYYNKYVTNRRYSDKAMVVTASRKSAAQMYEKLVELRGEDEVAVLYSSAEEDEDIIENNYVGSDERKNIRTAFKEDENPRILVVCSMLLTGFDAPVLGTIFMDRMLQEHRLMQAIARANRPNEGKKFGEIVDYWGITEDIENMYEDMNDEVTLYVSRNKEKFLEEFDSQLEELESQCSEDMPAHNAANIYENRNHDKFYEDFKRLRDIKSAVEPDKRIFEQNREERYEAMKQVYKTIKSVEEQDEVENTVDKKEFKKKAKKAIEDGAEVELEPDDNNTESNTTVDEWMPEEIRLRQKQRELESVLKKRSAQSPAFKDLSKRLEEIIEDWYQGQATENNMEEVNEIMEELDERTTPDEVDEREWLEQVAVDVLVEEVPMDLDVDDEMIDTIVDDFVQLWGDTRNITDEQERKSKIDTGIKKNMIRRSREYRKLVADTEFSSKATEYLARNMS